MSGGKRKTHRNRKMKRGGAAGAACESGEACATQFSADSSLSQGESFAKMTAPYHGGRRTRGNRKQRGGAADLSQAFEPMPAELHQQAGTAVLDQAIAELSKFAPQTGGSLRRQRGGSAMLTDAFQAPSVELHKESGTSVLDQAFAQLKQFIPNHNGGGRKGRKSRKAGGALGSSPVDAPSMLLRPEDYEAAFLNPQWEQENLVNPNFNAPASAYIAATSGGYRKRRSSYRKNQRKAKGKSRKMNRKASRKTNRKASRKH